MTEKDIQNQKNLEFHEANGIEIPYHQSVVIEDNVTIGKGTVISINIGEQTELTLQAKNDVFLVFVLSNLKLFTIFDSSLNGRYS